MDTKKGWIVDLLSGGLLGGLAGAVVAVNVVIFTGMERGYESTIPEVFRQNVFVGIVTVVILLAGPVSGVWLMRRRRERRDAFSRGG